MALTERNGIAIAEIVIYTPALFIALWLSIRHGFLRSSGWIYLLIFSTVRIVGGALQLAATTTTPPKVGLYVGAATLQTIALSPLVLALTGLLGRASESIRRSAPGFLVGQQHVRLIGLVMLVALLLGAVGGRQAGQDYGRTGAYRPSSLSKAGVALTAAGCALLAAAAARCGLRASAAEPGEKRLVLAVALSLPFLLVRLVYAAAAAFAGGDGSVFSLTGGSVGVQLGMAVVMEMLVVAIVEGIGLTVRKQPPSYPKAAEHGPLRQSGEEEDTSYGGGYPMEQGHQHRQQQQQQQQRRQ